MSTHSEAQQGPDLTDEAYWDSLNRRSVSRFFLLATLYEAPRHGYELRRAIGECCQGAEPTDAMVYPTLKALVEGGYIACDAPDPGGRARKVCRLTERGVEAYRAGARAWGRMLPYLQQCVNAADGRTHRERGTE
ncbi:MAG: PadR family transcriptional regulator [Chloroflexota bacterium]